MMLDRLPGVMIRKIRTWLRIGLLALVCVGPPLAQLSGTTVMYGMVVETSFEKYLQDSGMNGLPQESHYAPFCHSFQQGLSGRIGFIICRNIAFGPNHHFAAGLNPNHHFAARAGMMKYRITSATAMHGCSLTLAP